MEFTRKDKDIAQGIMEFYGEGHFEDMFDIDIATPEAFYNYGKQYVPKKDWTKFKKEIEDTFKTTLKDGSMQNEIRKIAEEISKNLDIEKIKDEIEVIVDDYNRKYKVEDKSSPSAPDTSKFRATSGGWVRTRVKDGSFVLEIGSSFPKYRELLAELKRSFPNLRILPKSEGTNFDTYWFWLKIDGKDVKLKA